MHNKDIYFIVVTWNNQDIVLECLESIKRQTYKYTHVILIDNASSDNTVDVARTAQIDNLTIIENDTNEGFAIANNQGIRIALDSVNCGYIALLNSDARISTTWSEVLVTFAEKNKNVAALQTITLDYYDHMVVDSYGIKVGLNGNALQLGYRNPLKESLEDKRVFGVNAAACIYTADFLRAQPFDNDYFDSDMWMYLEDVDLAARAVVLGYSSWVIANGGAYAYHMGSASSNKNPGFSVFYIYRNNLLMLVKNFPARFLIRMIPGIIYTDLKTLLILLRHRNFLTIRALIRGRSKSFLSLPLFWRKRKILLAKKQVSSRDLKELMRST